MQDKATKQEKSGLLLTRDSLLHVLKIIRNNCLLKCRMGQSLADCNSTTQKRRARDKLLPCIGYNYFVLRYTTRSEERLASTEMHFEVAYRKLLKAYEPNDVSTFFYWSEYRHLSLIPHCGF